MSTKNNSKPNNNSSNDIYGAHSKEVEQQKKFIGLLHAISAIGSKEIA